MINQYYIFENYKSFYNILKAENAPFIKLLIGLYFILLIIYLLIFSFKSAIAMTVVYACIMLFVESLYIISSLKVYINIKKYKKLEIFIDKITVNNIAYSMQDITFKTFIFWTRYGTCVKTLTLLKDNKTIGKFYFQVNDLKFFKMDLEVIEDMLSDFKNNVTSDYQKIILNNINSNYLETKQNKENEKSINILVIFIMLLPIMTVVIFFYWLK